MLKRFSFYKATGATTETSDLAVSAGKALVLVGIDFGGPGGQSTLQVIRDPAGAAEVLSMANGDKYVQFPPGSVLIEGADTIRISLKGTGGAALMGVTVLYEELG